MKNKLFNNKVFITLIIIDIFAFGCFFTFYGPISSFREFLITSAMTTKSHRYLAKTFYSNEVINKVLSENYVMDFNTGSDSSQIVIGEIDKSSYASIYEKEILEHDGDYKLIKFNYNNYPCYLVAIYDPSRISLVESKYIGSEGQTLTDMAKSYDGTIFMNAGGFSDIDSNGVVGQGSGGNPVGIVIKDGKIMRGNPYVGTNIAGFNKDGILVLSYSTGIDAINNGIRDAVEFGPFLIVNGVSATISGNGGWGINPRTVIAQRKDGIVLFLIVDGNGVNSYNWNGRGGATMNDLIAILERYGAYNAVNMDGGASTTLVINKELINSPCGTNPERRYQRRLPNAWMFK